nr:hypothetical protein [Streptomyces sp. SLBN-118]
MYRELLQLWASRGRTLPGRRDPEWSRLAAPPAFASARADRGRGSETTYRTATISAPWPTAHTGPATPASPGNQVSASRARPRNGR